MSGERTRSFGDLSAEAGRVVRGLGVLGLSEVTVEEVAAAAGLSVAHARTAVAELTEAGWLVTARHGRYAVRNGSRAHTADHRLANDAQEVRRRFGEHALDAVSSTAPDTARTWIADHPTNLLATVRLGAEHGHFELAARLAAAVWELTPDISDQQWWHDLARWGEEAAIGWRNPRFLATLLTRSARFFQHVQDFQTAETRWARALRVGRRLPDRALTAEVLDSLSKLYDEWGRLHRKLDVQLDLLLLHQQSGSPLEVARTHFAIGSTMLAANRADTAVEHLSSAERAFEALSLGEAAEQERAEILICLGRGHWRLGANRLARRCFDRALAIVVDRDEDRAERIRTLLATPAGEPLPDG